MCPWCSIPRACVARTRLSSCSAPAIHVGCCCRRVDCRDASGRQQAVPRASASRPDGDGVAWPACLPPCPVPSRDIRCRKPGLHYCAAAPIHFQNDVRLILLCAGAPRLHAVPHACPLIPARIIVAHATKSTRDPGGCTVIWDRRVVHGGGPRPSSPDWYGTVVVAPFPAIIEVPGGPTWAVPGDLRPPAGQGR